MLKTKVIPFRYTLQQAGNKKSISQISGLDSSTDTHLRELHERWL